MNERVGPKKKVKPSSTTYADKLIQWREELQKMASELMENDDFEVAQKIVAAGALLKQAHDEMADLGIHEEEWKPEEEVATS